MSLRHPGNTTNHPKKPLHLKCWERVVVTGRKEDCWNWIGVKDINGYGRILHNGRFWRAHRIAYELSKGEIPVGLTLDHLCRNRACCNPDHLEPVTLKENVLRGNGTGATCRRRDACCRGHRYQEGTYKISQGARRCLICERLRRK